jgi:hypothetical protein
MPEVLAIFRGEPERGGGAGGRYVRISAWLLWASAESGGMSKRTGTKESDADAGTEDQGCDIQL